MPSLASAIGQEHVPLDRLAHVVGAALQLAPREVFQAGLTDEGESLIQTAADMHAARMQELMDVLDESEKQTLVQLLTRLAEAAKKKS